MPTNQQTSLNSTNYWSIFLADTKIIFHYLLKVSWVTIICMERKNVIQNNYISVFNISYESITTKNHYQSKVTGSVFLVETAKLRQNKIKVWQLCVVWAMLGLSSSWFYWNFKFCLSHNWFYSSLFQSFYVDKEKSRLSLH